MNISFKSLMSVLTLFCFSFSVVAEDIDKLEAEMEKFIKLKREAVAAKNKWKEEKAVLSAEKKLLVTEKERLSKEYSKLKKSLQNETKKAEGLIKKLEEKQNKLKKYETVYQQNLKKLHAFKSKLPEFLKKKIDLTLDKMGPEMNVAQRISLLAAAFNEIKQTSGKWNYAQETIKVGSEKLLCNVLFAGISTGYAVNADQSRAFTGVVDKGGWHWAEATEVKSEIKKAIKAFKAGDISTVKLPFPKGAKK